ncbi:MAG TPA: hypothetical protein PLV45_15525 [bacterium]|nr:hypothetical protein [bacterium]
MTILEWILLVLAVILLILLCVKNLRTHGTEAVPETSQWKASCPADPFAFAGIPYNVLLTPSDGQHLLLQSGSDLELDIPDTGYLYHAPEPQDQERDLRRHRLLFQLMADGRIQPTSNGRGEIHESAVAAK